VASCADLRDWLIGELTEPDHLERCRAAIRGLPLAGHALEYLAEREAEEENISDDDRQALLELWFGYAYSESAGTYPSRGGHHAA